MNLSEKTTMNTITKESIMRLLKDVKQIMRNPLIDNGIYYHHDEEDMLKGYAMIIGPKNTPYFGGYYFFKFNFPYDYPFNPPIVEYMTNDGLTRFNPNLYKCGKVCVSILNTWSGDKWTSCQTINSILLTLCSLLNENPIFNEPGMSHSSPDIQPYHNSIEYTNINFAICDMIDKSKKVIPEKFEIFYPNMKKNFFENYDNIIEFIDSKNKIVTTYYVQIFSMRTSINYIQLKKKIIALREKLLLENL
jgi:ubiquitin-protein ligase